MIQRDLSFYYPDCNKEVCLVIASESLQCMTQLTASYYSVSLIVSATSSAKKRKVGPSIQRGRKNTFLWSALDSPVPHMLEDCGRS